MTEYSYRIVQRTENLARESIAAMISVTRVYLRISTDVQDLERLDSIVESARVADYYIGGVYREKSSGARSDRSELLRIIGDLQTGERCPLPKRSTVSAVCRWSRLNA